MQSFFVLPTPGDLCVWYSIDTPDRVAIVPIKGDVEDIERSPGRTEVIVDEGTNTVAYGLDEALIEFGSAMEMLDYARACSLLEQITMTPGHLHSIFVGAQPKLWLVKAREISFAWSLAK